MQKINYISKDEGTEYRRCLLEILPPDNRMHFINATDTEMARQSDRRTYCQMEIQTCVHLEELYHR